MFKPSKLIMVPVCLFFIVSIGSAWADRTSLKNGGRVFIYDTGNENAKIHTYMSPYKALANATHIVELKDSLVVVDMQFVKMFAEEFKAYADSLGKPIDRIFLSHEHPDHWMGSIAFPDAKIYALPETIRFLEANGEAILAAKKKPGKVPSFSGSVQPGTMTLGQITFELSKVKDAESGYALVIAIPELKTLITQDLLYSGTHLYMGNDHFTKWKETLVQLRSRYRDYEYFLSGHGTPASTVSIFDENIAYLKQADKAFIVSNKDPEKIQAILFKAYPDLKARSFVPFSVGRALKNPQEHK